MTKGTTHLRLRAAAAGILLLGSVHARAQTFGGGDPSDVRKKLETIITIQDRRTVHDGYLIDLLDDPNPVIRERAVRAYGSIQDSTVIPLLLDRFMVDRFPIAFAAAFALGQTGTILSEGARETLEHDIIWARLDESEAPDRMIEELGRFGTIQALRELMLRFSESTQPARVQALVMSIARFAIRGIRVPEATTYILRRVRGGGDPVWQDYYALQRIGSTEETRSAVDELAAMVRDPDPLVRMNLATLLGKIANARSSVEPLRKLAESDDDWRVRVNAFKALSSFRLQREDAVLTSFRRAFTDANMSVALTALTALGTARIVLNDSSAALTDLRTVLERIAWNEGDAYLWQLQAEAGAALAALEGKPAFPKLRLGDGPNRILRGRVLGAMGLTGNPDALPVLVPYAQGNDALLFRSALEGMQELSRRNRGNSSVVGETYASAIKALQVNDVALVTTAASVLGDSLFLRPSSVDPLIDRLGQLRIPDDIEAIQEIVATLGTLKNPRAEGVLESTMKRPDRSVALAAAAALRAITGRDPSPGFPSSFEPLYTDFDYAYLNGLPETVHVALETIRGNIVLELYRNVAPFTVMSLLKQATQRGFFRGIPFHRVVPNFVVQGGDPRGDGWGGPGYSIRSEFSWLRYDRGTVGMASAGKDTEGSQFFITHSPQPHLDGRYTIIGNVVSGMDIVDRLQIDDHILDLKILP